MSPQDFAADIHLESTKFTNGKTDKPFVIDKYRATVVEVIDAAVGTIRELKSCWKLHLSGIEYGSIVATHLRHELVAVSYVTSKTDVSGA